jgi:hypothetical protein
LEQRQLLSRDIAAVSRDPSTLEVWWVGPDGSVQDAYFYAGLGWNYFPLEPAGSASTSGGIAAVSSDPSGMDVWWVGPGDILHGAFWDAYSFPQWQTDPTGGVSLHLE